MDNLTIRLESLRGKRQSGNDHRLKPGFFYSPLGIRGARVEGVTEDSDTLSATIREHGVSDVGKYLSRRDAGLKGKVVLTMGSTGGLTDDGGP